MRSRALAAIFCLAGCGLFSGEQDTRPALLYSTNLEDLGPDHDYVAWLVVEGEPVSLGPIPFDEDEKVEIAIGVEDAELATEFFVTIEEEGEAGPSSTVVVAGAFDAYDGARASGGDDRALGTDFSVASVAYVLDTPTTDAADDYAHGVWFHDPTGQETALRLPELSEGWIYEGWATVDGVRRSTGRFAGLGEDSDAAGPQAGPGVGYDAPGQDFVGAGSLVGSRIAITVEPEPDISEAPFFIEPFALEGILDFPPSRLTSLFAFGTVEVIPTVDLELPPVEEMP